MQPCRSKRLGFGLPEVVAFAFGELYVCLFVDHASEVGIRSHRLQLPCFTGLDWIGLLRLDLFDLRSFWCVGFVIWRTENAEIVGVGVIDAFVVGELDSKLGFKF